MPQVLVSPSDIANGQFHIRGSEAHHVIRVLRKKVNDEIHFFDGQGRSYIGKITSLSGPESPTAMASGQILQGFSNPQKSVQIHLFQGFPRGPKFDYVLEKATELGCDVIIPFLSGKNPLRWDETQKLSKVSRWEKVLKAASKQCNRSALPLVEEPQKLMSLGSRFKNALSLLFWEKEKEFSLREILQQNLKTAQQINLIIGPESGFTQSEVDWMIKQGAIPVSLGALILRTETAGLVGLSVLNYELGLF